MSECVVRIPKHRIEEMRKIGCGGCPFKFQNCLLKEDVEDTCPILAVLPEKHGRLVDADALNKTLQERYVNGQTGGRTVDVVKAALFQHAPTIVPATEGGKE